MNTKLIACNCAILLLAGCGQGPSDSFLPIENGYGYGGHSEGWPDRKTWAGLQYQDATGKRKDVWKYLSMASPVVQITNNLAIMVGGVFDGTMNRFNDRLIAFEAPAGPPVDITDQILNKYCVENGVAFTNVTKDSFVSLTKTNASVQIEFSIVKRNVRGPGDYMAADATAIISWNDIEAIMANVKNAGKLKTEKWSGMEYLQKE